ncbi:MAG: LpxL/LpxP family Kdo(2)-lipid IV(A) lauroyl/palmitoleoyl acyltransferase [Gammaproteobacteria bacterium]|nr:LpxL/LpxP family Kdo(2)-lipid IV(A) lauroyl/palmitoleoyl acyltransferase [Gammaproteobacteria bacterium]
MAPHRSGDFAARDYWHPRYWPMWVTIGLLRVVAYLPFRGQILLGKLLGKAIQHLPGARQRIVDINLQHCFPGHSASERDSIKNCCYKNIGISIVEMSMCWWWPEDKLKSIVEIRGKEHIDAVLASGQGVILLTGHFTSLEIGARLLALFMSVQVMYRKQKNRMFDSYLYAKRNSYFVNTIPRNNTRQLIKGIRNQIPTWYAPDQDFRSERNVFAPFFGVETATITASSRIAKSSGGAVLPFYPERKKDGSGYILWVEPPLHNFPDGDDLQDASRINASIEKFARQHPGHYMWIHRRFMSRPEGDPTFYS